jgi:sulfite exporter TauE/SafE
MGGVVSEKTTVWGGAAGLLPAAIAAPARILAAESASPFESALAVVAAFFPVLSTNSTVLAFRVVPAVFRWERLSTQNPIILKE